MRTFENSITFWLMRTCAQQNFSLFPPMRSRSAIFSGYAQLHALQRLFAVGSCYSNMRQRFLAQLLEKRKKDIAITNNTATAWKTA
jgi:hypothetical protein